MRKFGKFLDYFFTGMGFGSICYLCVLTFANPGVPPTAKGVVSIFILSGLIGILSMVFKTDLPLLLAIIIHFIGSLILFLIMNFINNWLISWDSIFIFILVYIIIWLIILLEQRKTVNKLNAKIKQRNFNRKS